jgi:hypothetical protein
LILILLLVLFGGGGFYIGGPYVGGGLGTILLIILIIVIVRGIWRSPSETEKQCTMTVEDFATQLERLIAQAGEGGLTDELIIVGLEEAIDSIEEGLA